MAGRLDRCHRPDRGRVRRCRASGAASIGWGARGQGVAASGLCHPDDCAEYVQLKRRLAAELPHDGAAYTEAKVPFFWEAIRRADEWAQRTGWEPGPSDA